MRYQDYIQVKPLKILMFVDKNNRPSVNKVVDVLNYVHGDNYVARSIYIDELWSLRSISLCRYISDYEAIYITTDSKKERSRIRRWLHESFGFDAHIQKYSTISRLYKRYCMQKKETLKFFKSTVANTLDYNDIKKCQPLEINIKEENNNGK